MTVATEKVILQPPRRWFQILAVGLWLGGSFTSVFAAGLEQIRPLSKLPEIDLAKLKQGDVIGARGPNGNFPRGIYAESCYFIHAAVPVVGTKLLHWNSAKHRELEISALREFRWPAPANAWDSLALKSSRREDQWLTDRTWQLRSVADTKTDLHVSRADIASFQELARRAPNNPSTQQRDGIVNEFWRKLLRARDDALAHGGLAAVPSYSADGIEIAARPELDSLLRQTPEIAAHFRTLVGGPPFNPGAAANVEIVPYWQAARARGHTNLHAAFFAGRKGASSWQLADCTYYVSDTYFMSITLYELFPQDNGALVWQIDYASAPFRSFTGGLDRLFAGGEMLKEAAKTAELFRSDLEKSR